LLNGIRTKITIDNLRKNLDIGLGLKIQHGGKNINYIQSPPLANYTFNLFIDSKTKGCLIPEAPFCFMTKY